MRFGLFTAALACLTFVTVEAKNHAVLIATSKSYSNYRHQSNTYATYQALLKAGMSAENIIVLAYDDIANSPSNPFPGKVFNKPTSRGAVEVYNGVKIDYKGDLITPERFLAVIQGDKAKAGGRVLESTENDNVFIFMSDHGARGIVAFPDHSYLYADKLVAAFRNMKEKKMYKKLVMYLEACESGSMFEKVLPNDIDAYAVTGANSHESHYGTFCSGVDSVVEGKSIGTCLSGEFTQAFLSHLGSAKLDSDTIGDQFVHIKQKVVSSHPMKFGSEAIEKDVVGTYFTSKNGKDTRDTSKNLFRYDPKDAVMVDERDMRLAFLKSKQRQSPSKQNAMKLMEELKSEEKFDELFAQIKTKLSLDVKDSDDKFNFNCLRERQAKFVETCGQMSEYGLKYVDYIHKSCSQDIKTELYNHTLNEVCAKNKVDDLNKGDN